MGTCIQTHTNTHLKSDTCTRTHTQAHTYKCKFKEYQWPCGTSYKGDVLRGKRHGYGLMRFSDSAAVYEGQWQHGERHGQGKLCLDAQENHWYKGECVGAPMNMCVYVCVCDTF